MMMGCVLDHLADAGWHVADAGRSLGISTGQLISLLKEDPGVWTHVNRLRREQGLKALI